MTTCLLTPARWRHTHSMECCTALWLQTVKISIISQVTFKLERIVLSKNLAHQPTIMWSRGPRTELRSIYGVSWIQFLNCFSVSLCASLLYTREYHHSKNIGFHICFNIFPPHFDQSRLSTDIYGLTTHTAKVHDSVLYTYNTVEPPHKIHLCEKLFIPWIKKKS
jgi:hypothetical protein